MNTNFQHPIKNRYYKGKLLRAEDFQTEQDYNQFSRNCSQSLLHGKGIIDGLTIIQKEDTHISLTKGHCINASGQIIHVPTDINFKIEELNGFERAQTNQLDVFIGYKENACQAMYATISDRDDNMEPNYIQDDYQLLIQDSKQDIFYDSYFDNCKVFSNEQICIIQSIPMYISSKDIFLVTVRVKNITEYTHDVSFVYHLQSPNIINAKGQKKIIIHGKIKNLEKEQVFTFYVKKNQTVGGSKHAYFTLQTNRAIVVIDGVQYPLECTYERSLLLVENMPLFLKKVTQQESIIEDTNSFVKIATIQIQRSTQETKISDIYQEDALYMYTNRIQKKVDGILDLYGIRESKIEDTVEIKSSIEEEKKYSTSGVIEIEVPGYRRHQEPICTTEMPHGLPGRVQMTWSLEKRQKSYLQEVLTTKQYYGDATLFPEMEQYNYQIACKVIEDKQSFKFAIKAKRNTTHAIIYLRWYATLIEEMGEPIQNENTIKMQPEFVILKPEQSILFTIIFNNPRQEELCDFSIMEGSGGTISEEGRYIAPKNNGVYKVVAVGRKSGKIAKAIIVVKDEIT